MWKFDGWEAPFRVGVVTPHADVGPEAEFQAMLVDSRATVHGARVNFSPMHPGGTIDDKIRHDPVLQFVSPNVIDPTVEALSCAPLDAIGLAFTSSSFKMGTQREQELLARLGAQSHGISLHTTASASVAAMRHLQIESVAVMAPTWFDDELCDAGTSYFRDQGINVLSTTPSGPPGGPLSITPESTFEAVRLVVESTRAKAVLIAGNGQRAIGAVDRIERELDVVALTANQVLLWACLDGSEIRGRIHGYGRLFTS